MNATALNQRVRTLTTIPLAGDRLLAVADDTIADDDFEPLGQQPRAFGLLGLLVASVAGIGLLTLLARPARAATTGDAGGAAPPKALPGPAPSLRQLILNLGQKLVTGGSVTAAEAKLISDARALCRTAPDQCPITSIELPVLRKLDSAIRRGTLSVVG